MNGKAIGYDYNLGGYWDNQPCPQWVMREQFYNCENFWAVLTKRGFSLDRLFGRRNDLES